MREVVVWRDAAQTWKGVMIRTFGKLWACGLLVLSLAAPVLGGEVSHDSVSVRLAPVGTNVYPPVITALAVDPSGQWIAAAGDDHHIRIISRSELKTEYTLTQHHDWVRGLEFSHDGSLLASVGNDGQLVLWDRDLSWSSTKRVEVAPALRAVAFAPDSRMVAAVGFAPQVHLFGVSSDLQPTLNCSCRDLRSITYRADAAVLATAGRSGDVHLYDPETGSSLGEIQLHRQRICDIQFIGQTSMILSVGEDGHAVVYDTDTRRVVRDIAVPDCKLFAACVIDDNHIAVGGSDNAVRIYRVDSGEVVSVLVGHSGSIAALAVINGDLYSGSFDTTLRSWNIRSLINNQRVAEIDSTIQPDARTSRLTK